TKHRCGSKSLPVRVAAAKIIYQMQNNGGVVPAVTEMYKSTHFNEDKQKWISSESEVLYDKMVQIETEHNAQEGAIPIMQEALSVKGFKASEQAEGIEAANIKIDELMQAKEEQGKTLASVMAFLKQQGFIG
ncbi:hypothetical protein C3L33_21889, partial [Rhododendron williamsianum]